MPWLLIVTWCLAVCACSDPTRVDPDAQPSPDAQMPDAQPSPDAQMSDAQPLPDAQQPDARMLDAQMPPAAGFVGEPSGHLTTPRNRVDSFGQAIAISGDTLVIGAPLDSSASKGVNGDASDNTARDSGAAYVFVWRDGSWQQQAYLKASNTDAGDNFGQAVAISGDRIVVGAFLEGSRATGVDGDQDSNTALWSGAAYVFKRVANVWSQVAYLKASNTAINDRFGASVAISGDTVIVGADGESSNASGVDGAQGNDLSSTSGAAYVFVDGDAGWSQQAYLKAHNTDVLDLLGWSVAIDGDIAVVGAIGEASNGRGVNGDGSNNSAAGSGAAYVFAREGVRWSQVAFLKASNSGAQDGFGNHLSISGDVIVVGAYAEDSGATGINGDQHNESATGSGAAYVFRRSAGNNSWSQEAYLKASNTGTDDNFGTNVSIYGERLVIGAYGEASNAIGVDGDQSNNSVRQRGAAYLFEHDAGQWTQRAYLKPQLTGTEAAQFGYSVAANAAHIAVGSHDETAASISGAGAVHVFR